MKKIYLIAVILLLSPRVYPQWVQCNGSNSGLYGGCVNHIAVSGKDLFAGANFGIFHSANNGENWTRLNTIFLNNYGISCMAVNTDSSGRTNLFVRVWGTVGVYHSSDNGFSWRNIDSGLKGACINAFAVDKTNLYAGAGSMDTKGSIFISTNNGTNWKEADSGLAPTTVFSFAVIPNETEKDELLVSTISGIFRTTNNGANWVMLDSKLLYVDEFLVINNNQGGFNIFACGSYDLVHGLFLSTDNGASWRSASAGLPVDGVVTCLTGSTDGAFLFAGTTEGIFRSADQGKSWAAVNPGLTTAYVNDISVGPDGKTIFAGISWGGIFCSTDDGLSWNEANTGLTDVSLINFAVKESDIFAGSSNGIFVSGDNGSTWKALNAELPPNRIVSGFACHEGDILAGIDDELYISSDDGIIWSKAEIKMQVFDRINSFTFNETALFAGTEQEGVFRSTDKGLTWISSDIGTEINRWPRDRIINFNCLCTSGTDIFAGTDKGVLVSSDNGKSWFAADSGLQNKFLHSILILDKGILIGTEGGLYLSTNRGKSWSAVTTGLPANTYYSSLYAVGESVFANANTVTDSSNISCIILSRGDYEKWTNVSTGLPPATFFGPMIACNGYLFVVTGETCIWRRPLVEMLTPVLSQPELPDKFSLEQNYPNPFNPTTTIKFSLPYSSHVTLKIYDLLGSEVAVLIDEEKPEGLHNAVWKAENVSSGVYFYELRAGSFIEKRKMMLIR